MNNTLFWRKSTSGGMSVGELIRLWNEKCPDDAIDDSHFTEEELDLQTGIEIDGDGDCETLDRILMDRLLPKIVQQRSLAN